MTTTVGMSAVAHYLSKQNGLTVTTENNNTIVVSVERREELPIIMTLMDDTILCLVNICHVDDIKNDLADDLNKLLLMFNVQIPLSSYGILNNNYVVFGSLSSHSELDVILQEVITLSNNSINTLLAFENYLK